ncbi:unnamed protein product [Closterium sp. NIES-54]
MVTTTTPGGQRVSICTCTRTGRHLATFTRRPGSSLYTLATEPSHVAASAQVSASGPVAPPCSCRLLLHQTLLWHRRLGHPSLPRLRGMHSRLLVSGLPTSLPPLPPSPAPPCLPCVEGRQRAVPHSSFPTTTAPLQTLHMDRFRQDLPVLLLHSDRGGEFSSDLLWDFCRGEGILQSFMLPASSQKNGIAERRIGLVMEVTRTSMIHAAAPHFLWPFAVGDASVFWFWGSRAFVRNTSADKLSARAIPCVFLGFHPTSRRVFPSQDVMFDKPVPYYRLFPYRSAPPPPSPLFLAPGPPPVDPLPPQGPAPLGVSQVDPLSSTVPVEVAVDSAVARGAASGGAAPGGAEPARAEPGGSEPEIAGSEGVGGSKLEGVEPGVDKSEGAEPWGTASSGAAGAGDSTAGGTGAGGVEATRLGGAGVTDGAGGTGGAAAAGPGGARIRGTGAARTGSVEDARGVRGTGAGDSAERGGAGAGGAGAGGIDAGGAGAGGARAGDTGAGARDTRAVNPGAGGAGAGGVVSGGSGGGGTLTESTASTVAATVTFRLPTACSFSLHCADRLFYRAYPSPSPSPYTALSRPASPVHALRTGRRVPRPRPLPVPGTHAMALRPSSVPLRVPLLPPPGSSLPAVRDPESDLARAASPTVSCGYSLPVPLPAVLTWLHLQPLFQLCFLAVYPLILGSQFQL